MGKIEPNRKKSGTIDVDIKHQLESAGKHQEPSESKTAMNKRAYDQTFSPARKQKARRMTPPLRLGLLKLSGGGIRVLMKRLDYGHPRSTVEQILTPAKKDSNFKGKFRGLKHSEKITFNDENWCQYTYRWLKADDPSNSHLTLANLKALFEATGQFKYNTELPYENDNVRATVEILNDEELPMDALYLDQDIVEHCTSTQRKFELWREREQPFTQSEGFFWQDPASHASLQDTIDAIEGGLLVAPTLGDLSF